MQLQHVILVTSQCALLTLASFIIYHLVKIVLAQPLQLSATVQNAKVKRQITDNGVCFMLSNKGLFPIEMPAIMIDSIPSPMYRSHFDEFNKLILITEFRLHETLSRKRLTLALTMMILLSFSTALYMFNLIISSILSSLISTILFASFSYKVQSAYRKYRQELEDDIQDAVKNWNARAPSHIRFKIEIHQGEIHASINVEDDKGRDSGYVANVKGSGVMTLIDID